MALADTIAQAVQTVLATAIGMGLAKVVTLTRVTPGLYDPATNTQGAPVTVTVQVHGVTDDGGTQSGQGTTGDGARVRKRRLVLSPTGLDGLPLPFALTEDVGVAFEGEQWRLVGSDAIRPGETALAYTLDVER